LLLLWVDYSNYDRNPGGRSSEVKLNQLSSSITAVSDARQGGSATPKVFFNLSLQSREFRGLAAGVGYSLVDTGTMLAKLPFAKPRFFISSRIVTANPHHETLPAAVM
jgi:hypothetical protein